MSKRERPSGDKYSVTPAGQRDQIAYDLAKLRAAVAAGPKPVKLAPDRPKQEQIEKAEQDTDVLAQGADSLVVYDLNTDDHYAELAKSGNAPQVIGWQHTVCSHCENTFQKSLTVCPSCGEYTPYRR